MRVCLCRHMGEREWERNRREVGIERGRERKSGEREGEKEGKREGIERDSKRENRKRDGETREIEREDKTYSNQPAL